MRYLLLAAVTLLVAGFIARHEIPLLIKESEHPAPPHAETDSRAAAQTAAVGHNTASAVRSGPADGVTARAAGSKQDPPAENLSSSERRRLTNLIGERAH